MRLTLYFSALLSFLYKNLNYFFIFIICGIVTYLMYINEDKKETKKFEKQIENYKNIETDKDIKKHKINHKKYLRNCVLPTRENPFMNVLVHEYKEEPDKPEGCIIEGEVGDKVEKEFNKNLIRDAEDIYNKNASQRQFYTMPVTSVINNQDEYTRFLYDIKPTCKEGAGQKCEERP